MKQKIAENRYLCMYAIFLVTLDKDGYVVVSLFLMLC